MTNSERTRLCERCLTELPEGKGEFFEVHVQAVADPTPPVLDGEIDAEELRSQYTEMVELLNSMLITKSFANAFGHCATRASRHG